MLSSLVFGAILQLLLSVATPCLVKPTNSPSGPTRLTTTASENAAPCNLKLGSPDTAFLSLFTDSSNERFYPTSDQESSTNPKELVISATQGQFTASCSNKSNVLSSSGQNEIDISCNNGVFTTSGTGVKSEDLNCKNKLKEIVSKGGQCSNGFTHVEIGFESQSKTLPLITLCHNENHDETLVVQHKIYGASFDTAEISNNRPSFKEASFYRSVSANTAYTQNNQKETVKTLVGSATLANEYINPPESLYLARGHLAPDGDFIFAYEQNATYYYVNVAPQWQTINNGNWKALEAAGRKIALNNKTTLQIWTGVKDILELKDSKNRYVEIFLIADSAGRYHIPVPKLLWKVLYNADSESAVAIIMVNNPHSQGVTSSEIICPDICDQIKWVKWDTKNIRKGYTYCCSVRELRKAVGSDVPDLGNVSLLTD